MIQNFQIKAGGSILYLLCNSLVSSFWLKTSGWMVVTENNVQAPAFNAATNMSLASTIVPVIQPLEISTTPSTLLERFRRSILNCSAKTILSGSHNCCSKVAASLELFILILYEAFTLGL